MASSFPLRSWFCRLSCNCRAAELPQPAATRAEIGLGLGNTCGRRTGEQVLRRARDDRLQCERRAKLLSCLGKRCTALWVVHQFGRSSSVGPLFCATKIAFGSVADHRLVTRHGLFHLRLCRVPVPAIAVCRFPQSVERDKTILGNRCLLLEDHLAIELRHARIVSGVIL